MKNPQLMLKAQGRRFRVVVVGDTYQGEKRGILYVPKQPRAGLVKTEALTLAEQWTPSKVIAFAAAREGSYVYPSVRPKLIKLTESFKGGFKSERPTTTVASKAEIPKVTYTAPTVTDEAAELIVQRRAALRAIAEIDSRLNNLIDPTAVEVIQRGMSLPLAALN